MSANVLYFPDIDEPKTQEVQIVADCDEGYTRIANTLLEAICRLEVTARQMRVLMTIIRKTYGYQKKADWIASSQIAEEMGYEGCQSHLRADISTLKKRNIIKSDGRKIGPNPVITEWVFTQKSTKVACRNQHKSVPKSAQKCAEISTNTSRKRHTQKKDINTKESIKETIVGKPDDGAVKILEYLNSRANRKFKPTKTNLGFINARIKEGFSQDDLKSVIDKKTDEWEHDARMSQYLRPATLFNSEKFDGYVNAPAVTPNQKATQSRGGRIAYNPDDTSWADGFNPFDPMEL